MQDKIYNDIVLGNYEVEPDKYLQNDNSRYCYLALISALQRKQDTANQYLKLIREAELSDREYAVYLESKAFVSYLSGNFDEMKNYAEQALRLNYQSFFARSLIARVLTWEKGYGEAIEHYRTLLELYPLHSSTLLDLAYCMLVSKGNYQEILSYVLKAKKSFRRNMYLLLIPLGKPIVRLFLTLAMLALFSTSQLGVLFFVVISMLIVIAVIVTLIKLGLDFLIITRLIGLQGIVILTWLLSWIALKYW